MVIDKVCLCMFVYEGVFKVGYCELYDFEEVFKDVIKIEFFDDLQQVVVWVYIELDDVDNELWFKIYCIQKLVLLFCVMLVLENFGLVVVQEIGFLVDCCVVEGQLFDCVYVYDFEMKLDVFWGCFLEEIVEQFEDVLLVMVEGCVEDDGFNCLIVEIGVNWCEVVFLCICVCYCQQMGLDLL